jgi:hypothetical protein
VISPISLDSPTRLPPINLRRPRETARMGKLLKVWLRLLTEEVEWFDDHPTTIAGYQKAFKEHYEENNDPQHLMLAFNHAVQHGIAKPQWVIEGLDKTFDKYRPLSEQTEGMGWLTSVEVMNRWGFNDLTLAKHISIGELDYYIRSGKWLSEEVQAVRQTGKVIYQGRTWIDRGEITFAKIVENLSDLAFSMKDVIEFETKHLINKLSSLGSLLIKEQLVTEEKAKPQYVFKKAGENRRGKVKWKIVYQGMELPELDYKGLMYVQYYMKHPDDKLFNHEIAQDLEPGMPVETKRLDIDYKEDEKGEMKYPDGYQVGGIDAVNTFQPVGDRKTLKQCLEEIVRLDSEIEKEKDPVGQKELIEKREFYQKQKDDIIVPQKGKRKGLENLKSEEFQNVRFKGFEDQETKKIDERIRASMDELLRNLKGIKGPGTQEFADHLEKSLKPSYSSHSRKWYSPSSSIKWDFGDD